MKTYQHLYELWRDSGQVIAEGATLRSLYDLMLGTEEAQEPNAKPWKVSQQTLVDLTTRKFQNAQFAGIRLCELFGDTRLEHSDDYVLTMIGYLGGRYQPELRPFLLRHDHALRNEVFWRIFEVEGGGEISLANVDKFSIDNLNWHHTVVLLSNEGTIERKRVLRSCLEALNRDFSSYRAGWFSRVYSALEPTPEEAAADQDLLLLCLGSSVTATLSLGVKQLEAVFKAGRLNAAAFVEASGGAFSGPKAAAISVVRMLQGIAATGEWDVDVMADALLPGLGHAHADVQRACILALQKLGREDLAHAARDALAPAVVAQLLPESQTAAPVAQLDSMHAVSTPQPEALTPWTDDTALERYAALLEAGDDAIELELAMAWLAESRNAATVVAPLLKRARSLLARIEDNDVHLPAALLVSAVEPETEFLPQTFFQATTYENGAFLPDGDPIALALAEDCSPVPSFIMRMRELVAMTRGHTPRRALLATPTDAWGWIDLQVLLRRIDEAVRAKSEFATTAPADLVQALLRVRPEDRARAALASGMDAPQETSQIKIEWSASESNERKPNGAPMWVFWRNSVQGDDAQKASRLNPALIPSLKGEDYCAQGPANELLIAQLALATPESTLPLVAVSLDFMCKAAGDYVEHRAPAVLKALGRHAARWTPETAQLLALGMGAKQTDLRALAVELFATAIPARIDIMGAADGFAACSGAVVLTRWAHAFKDAATLAPQVVIALLTSLLPQLDAKAHGIGALLTVLYDESLRHAVPVADQRLRDWLAGFTGSSAAAKTAKALLK